MMRVVFSTYGSLGDVYPFLAIAQELRKRGVRSAFVTNGSNVPAVQEAGFEVHGIVTDAILLFEKVGLHGEAAIDVTSKSINKFWHTVMPEFSSHLKEIDGIASDASAIIGPPWAFNAQTVAEKNSIPFIGAHLWPLGFISAHDPPVLRDIPGLIRNPRSAFTIAWNRLVIFVASQVMKKMFAKHLNQPRQAYGLEKASRVPILDFQLKPERILGLYSRHFAPPAPDMPIDAELTGFPLIEDTFSPLDTELEAFMQKAPLVFTLGSILSENPGVFYGESVAAAKDLGLSALILTGRPDLFPQTPGILVRGYVPHSQVFPSARAIIHHGGIGTTARALVAGKPQLVVPHFGDQPDNAARLEKLGVARTLSSSGYTASNAASALSDILASETIAKRAALIATQINREDGAAHAARCIFEVIAAC